MSIRSFDPELGGTTLGARSARSAAVVTVAKTIRFSFVFLVQLILMNLLDPADFGLLRYVTIILGITALVNELGLSTAIVQSEHLDEHQLASSFTVSALFGAVLYSALFAMAPLLATFLGNDRLVVLIRVGTLAIPLGSASVVQQALLRRQLKFGLLSTCEVVSAVAGSLAAVIMAFAGYGVWSLVGSLLVHSFLMSALLLWLGPWPKGSFTGLRAAARLCIFGVGVVGLHVLEYLSSNLDYIFIGKLFGEAKLGIYGFAFETVMLPRLAVSVISTTVALSAMSRFQDDGQRMSRTLVRLTLASSLVLLPFFMLLAAFPREITHAVSFLKHGDKWLPAARPLRILAPMGLLYLLSTFHGTSWIARGRIRLCFWWDAAMLLSVVVAVLAGARFGVVGVCVAMLVRAALTFPALLVISSRMGNISVLHFVNALMPALVAGSIAAMLMTTISLVVPGDSFYRHIGVLLGGGIAGGAVYLAVLRVAFPDAMGALRAIVSTVLPRRVGSSGVTP